MVATIEPVADPKTLSLGELAWVVNEDSITVGGEVEQKGLSPLLSAGIYQMKNKNS